MTIIRVTRGRGRDTYEVANIEGMTDSQIIDKCDYNNWGGIVYRHEDTATVEVYTD